jgi:hypothetical protein
MLLKNKKFGRFWNECSIQTGTEYYNGIWF